MASRLLQSQGDVLVEEVECEQSHGDIEVPGRSSSGSEASPRRRTR